MLFALMGCAAQEFQLRTVAAAPFTEEKVDAQAKVFKKSQRPIEIFGLQPAGLLATGREEGEHAGESLHRRAGRFCILGRHLVRCFK